MIRITINNVSTPGTFFDNIQNDNMFVNEYYLKNIDQFDEVIKYIPKNAKVYIEDHVRLDINEYLKTELYSSNRYDYINKDNIDQYRSDKFDNLLEEINKSLVLNKEQYNSWVNFQDKHKECRIDENGRHKFGSIGGGSELVYQINYCHEEMFPKVGFLHGKCLGCEKTNKLSRKTNPIKNLDQHYESYVNYGPGFSQIEFYRFLAIYFDFKTTLEFGFMGTGLGYCIYVKANDFIFDITDTSNW